LLLRLERYEAALAELEAARKGLDPPPPELLADLVRAYRAAGRSADASAPQVLIEQSARSADGAPRNPRWGRALAAARS
jgi:hypothetical protein